jgi:hypothetical protein
MMGSVLSG